MASYHVANSSYVDDLLAGADHPEKALELHHSLRSLLSKLFFLSPQVAEQLTGGHTSISLRVQDLVDYNSAHHPKALCIEWDSSRDTMHVSITLPTHFSSTQHGIISDIARTFDVLGCLAPMIITMKIMYQKLWEEKLERDAPVPEPHLTNHLTWRQELLALSDLHIPRCYYTSAHRVRVELHGFCDASEAAYAAVVYVRSTYSDRTTPSCRMVIAKTKVAPVKPLTIPRLELCGASLLVKLLTTDRKFLNLPLDRVHAWSDSCIVLAWLDGSPKHYRTFVANQIASITTLIPPESWHHVPTAQNPADCVSRGITPTELRNHPLWWDGISWLAVDPIDSSDQPNEPELAPPRTLETKAVVCHTVTPVPPEWIELKFSSYHKLLCITAWALRAAHNLSAKMRRHPKRIQPHLTSSELTEAKHYLFTLSQARSFSLELDHLHHEHLGK